MDRPDFRYPNQEAITRRLAAAHGMTYEDVLDAPYGTEAFYVRKQAIGLASGEFAVKDGRVVCATCGGNCGQCGVTDTIGNVPFSFSTLVDSVEKGRPALRVIEGGGEPAYEKGDPWWHGATGPLDEERPQAMPNLLRKLAALPLLGKIGFVLLVILSWLPIIAAVAGIVMALTGCTTAAAYDPCERCIGPYDPALRSHREAIIESLN